MEDTGIIDAALAAYLMAFTFGLNALRARVRRRQQHLAYVAACILLSVAPLFTLKTGSVDYGAMTVVLAGVSFFWFAILGARQPALGELPSRKP